jgi:hypothetical protein
MGHHLVGGCVFLFIFLSSPCSLSRHRCVLYHHIPIARVPSSTLVIELCSNSLPTRQCKAEEDTMSLVGGGSYRLVSTSYSLLITVIQGQQCISLSRLVHYSMLKKPGFERSRELGSPKSLCISVVKKKKKKKKKRCSVAEKWQLLSVNGRRSEWVANEKSRRLIVAKLSKSHRPCKRCTRKPPTSL